VTKRQGCPLRLTTVIGAFALLSALLSLGCASSPAAGLADDDLGPVGDFALTERNSQTVHRDDLLGKVWVAAFIFTRCAGPCHQVTGSMARLQHDLAGLDDVVLVSFTVDPECDTPQVLSDYAKRNGADPQRWLFLTGAPDKVYGLIRDGFHLYAEPNRGAERTAGNEVTHDVRLALVDRRGHLRLGKTSTNTGYAYFDGTKPEDIPLLEEKVKALLQEKPGEIDFPSVNAALNGTSAVLLLLGYAAIRRRAIALHKTCMLGALVVSLLFLISYLYYHLVVRGGRPTYFTAEGWVRPLYFVLLVSHTLLAMATAPLALITACLGWRGSYQRHVAFARWTLPIWLYVSVTGVVVYWMLYHLYPSL